MKKNLMSVLILALVLVNLILTGILTITILPQTKKSNELVNKVCSAIDLELESGDGTESASIPMDQVETYKIEDAMTINLKTGADGETHYVKLTASISMDSKNDGYKTYGEIIILNLLLAIVLHFFYIQLAAAQCLKQVIYLILR